MYTFIKSPNSPAVYDGFLDGRAEVRVFIQSENWIRSIRLDEPSIEDESFRFMENAEEVITNEYQWGVPIAEAFFHRAA